MSEELSKAEKLKAAREARAKREAEATEAKELAEIEFEELVASLEKETNGKLGQSFQVVDLTATGDGFVALKIGPDVLFATYKESKMTVADLDAFIVPCLAHPSKDAYHRIIGERPAYADLCGFKLSELYGFRLQDFQGKR